VLAVADQGIAVLWSRDRVDSAHWIAELARRRQTHAPRDRPPYTPRPRSRDHAVPEAVVAAIPGISVRLAAALLARFGSVRGLTAASPTDWMAVPGIGAARARAIEQALMQPAPRLTPTPHQRSRRRRAT
jgi:ERCC4-type nuclease